MKLFKFRPLGSELDYCRAKTILETGKFWCSSFWELNDPMEGVYWYSHKSTLDILEKINKCKTHYKICSFSGEDAFSNPIMWGYYANGFKGIAIEIEVAAPSDSIDNMKYVGRIEDFTFVKKSNSSKPEIVTEILRTKLCKWSHEEEYRLLIENDDNENEIGKITNVYFGSPYEEVKNSNLLKDIKNISDYLNLKQKLKKTAKNNHINCSDVRIERNKVICNKNKCT